MVKSACMNSKNRLACIEPRYGSLPSATQCVVWKRGRTEQTHKHLELSLSIILHLKIPPSHTCSHVVLNCILASCRIERVR